MPDSPKFYYRDAKILGIPFQKYPKVHVFLGKYTALDGTERERWADFDPAHCPYIRYNRMANKMLVRRNPRELRGVLRRFTVKYWFWQMSTPRWCKMLPDYKLKLLEKMMTLLEKYIISGRLPKQLRSQGIERVMCWLMYTANRKIWVEKAIDGLPIE